VSSNLQQFVKFVLVSWICTAIDFGSYAALTRWFDFWASHLSLANALALLVTMIIGYLLNTYWVFQASHRTDAGSAAKFLVVSGSGLIASSSLFAFILWLGGNEWWTKLFLILFLFTWNFVGDRQWVYTTKQS
jgi:putative flippase GtrA